MVTLSSGRPLALFTGTGVGHCLNRLHRGESHRAHDLNAEYPGVTTIIQSFFAYYKGPDGGGMEYKGFGDEAEALAMVRTGVAAYEEANAAK